MVECLECKKWMKAPVSASALNCANQACRTRIYPPPGPGKYNEEDFEEEEEAQQEEQPAELVSTAHPGICACHAKCVCFCSLRL